jgi:hypothetical protein
MHFFYKEAIAFFMAVLFVVPVNVIAGSPAQAHAKPKLRNVELGRNGEVHGRVLDIHGRPVVDAPVEISTKSGKKSVRTNNKGQFKLDGLKGGVCVVLVGQANYGARLWAQGTAPPKSLKQFSVINDPNFVVRANDNGLLFGLTPAQLLGLGLVAGGIAAIAFTAADDDAS